MTDSEERDRDYAQAELPLSNQSKGRPKEWMMWFWEPGMTLNDSIHKAVAHYHSKHGQRPNRAQVSDRMPAEDVAVVSRTISSQENSTITVRYIAPRVIWLTYDANFHQDASA